MKEKYLDYIEGIFYINLDNRGDRRENFIYEAKKVRLPFYERFSAITPTNDELKGPFEIDDWRRFRVGCSLSHVEVIKIAKERGLKNCLIFEDDCVFTREYIKNIKKYIEELKTIEWDVFYLGGEPNNYCEPVTDNLYEIKNGGVYCCHAYLVNHTFFDKVLGFNIWNFDVIDLMYLNFAEHERKYILGKELLAIQSELKSDLRDINYNTLHMINAWKKFVP